MSSATKRVNDFLLKTRAAGDELRKSLESIRARIRDLQDNKIEIETAPPLSRLLTKELTSSSHDWRRLIHFIQNPTNLLRALATTGPNMPTSCIRCVTF